MTFDRRSWMACLGTFILAAALGQPEVARAAGDWEYVEVLGGWLDWDTGLVWGEPASDLSNGSWSWNGANNIFLPQYRALTGISQWRLPTVAELQVAYDHGAPPLVITDPLIKNGIPIYGLYWSSQQKGSRDAWTVSWDTRRAEAYRKTSYGDAVPVYRAF